MSELREELREHQNATDSSDDDMVEVLVGFLEYLDNEGEMPSNWVDKLMEFVVDNFDRGPP